MSSLFCFLCLPFVEEIFKQILEEEELGTDYLALRILDWKWFPSEFLQAWIHDILVSRLAFERLNAILIPTLLCVICFFSWLESLLWLWCSKISQWWAFVWIFLWWTFSAQKNILYYFFYSLYDELLTIFFVLWFWMPMLDLLGWISNFLSFSEIFFFLTFIFVSFWLPF